MMGQRTIDTREFKVATVTLVAEQGMSRAQVARDMGIDIHTLGHWVKEAAADGDQAFPGSGHAHEEELVRLRRKNEQLRQERDILKKALGIFSRMPE